MKGIIPSKYEVILPILEDIYLKTNDGLNTSLINGDISLISTIDTNNEEFFNRIQLIDEKDNSQFVLEIEIDMNSNLSKINIFDDILSNQNVAISKDIKTNEIIIDESKIEKFLEGFCDKYNKSLKNFRNKIEKKKDNESFFKKIINFLTVDDINVEPLSPLTLADSSHRYLSRHLSKISQFNQYKDIETDNYIIKGSKESKMSGQSILNNISIFDKKSGKTINIVSENTFTTNREHIIDSNFTFKVLGNTGQEIKISEKKLKSILLPAVLEANNFLREQKYENKEVLKI